MDDSDKTIKIQRLKGASNYRIWSAEISAHLEGKGLMGVTLGEEPKPDELNTPHWNTQAVGTTEASSSGVESGSIEDSSLDKWKRKDAKSRSLIMAHCQTHIKDKIVHLQTAREMWETLKKDYRLASNVSLATYTNRFYSYEPKKDATVDSISNELQDLQSAIFMKKVDEKPTELSKICALLRAVRKLDSEFSTRIGILEDRLDILDFEATVLALKEAESRIETAKLRASREHKVAEGSFAGRGSGEDAILAGAATTSGVAKNSLIPLKVVIIVLINSTCIEIAKQWPF